MSDESNATAVAQPSNDRLPVVGEMSRDEMLDTFVRVVNVVEPEHSYYDTRDEWLPLQSSDVDFGYKKGRYYASCGPRKSLYNTVSYSVNAQKCRGYTTERYLSICVHELTHLSIGTHNGRGKAPMHPPMFWTDFAFYAWELLDEWHTVQEWFDVRVNREAFVDGVIGDPNRSMVDRRSESVEEVRERMARYLANASSRSVDELLDDY